MATYRLNRRLGDNIFVALWYSMDWGDRLTLLGSIAVLLASIYGVYLVSIR